MMITVEPKFRDIIFISLNLSWYCNFKCSYCYNKHECNDRTQIAYAPMMKFLNKVQEKYPDKQIFLYISGGEPTICEDFDAIIRGIKANFVAKVSIVSNASKPVNWWSEKSYYFDSITLSYHHGRTHFNHLYNVCQHILKANNRCPLMVSLMLYQDQVKEIYELGRKLFQLEDVIVNARRINGHEYSQEETEYMNNNLQLISPAFRQKDSPRKKNPMGIKYILIQDGDVTTLKEVNDCMMKGDNKWSGWHCNAGIESFCINPTGDVFRANCLVGGAIGNINEDVNLGIEPIICDIPACSCRTDIHMTRWKE